MEKMSHYPVLNKNHLDTATNYAKLDNYNICFQEDVLYGLSVMAEWYKVSNILPTTAPPKLVASEIGFGGCSRGAFLNDHLNPEYKRLLTSTKL